jgi:hypothetical protein
VTGEQAKHVTAVGRMTTGAVCGAWPRKAIQKLEVLLWFARAGVWTLKTVICRVWWEVPTFCEDCSVSNQYSLSQE